VYHYLAFRWNFLDVGASLHAAELASALERGSASWTQTFASAGLWVYTQPRCASGLRVYVLPRKHGVVLGRLFPGEPRELTPGWEPTITERDAARYLDTAGRRLTEDYWGAYVALLSSPTEPRGAVLRDPSGKLPCYWLRHAQVDVLFSDIADLTALPLPPPTPNFQYLAAFIYRDSLQIRESALAEVSEILAGECIEFRHSSTRHGVAWDPRSIMAGGCRPTYDEAARTLRSVTQACIDAWATVHRRVLHCLSGGLDSAIVLGCLSRAPSTPEVVCMNRYLEGDEGDERPYARIAAERAKVPLIESSWNPETFAFDTRMLALPKSAKPSFSQCSRLIQLEVINREALRHGADAVWKGQGGDHLFLKAANIPSAADYWADRGMRCGLAGAVRDAARLSAQPYFSVLRSTLSSTHAPHTQAPRADKHGIHFVRPDALPRDSERYVAHPWDLEAEGLPPGRRRQIHLLGEVLNRHRPIPRREFAYEHHPLLSQPIVEHCLRTPTYLHLRGGRHRALARDAFHDIVPERIIQREDKGETTSFVVESVRRAASFLCEMMLDGVLARERVVDRAQLEICLRDGQALAPEQLSPLLASIAAETWIRAWSGRGSPA
jgi:asparagine synthase (glutamine-hydrolysing)